mgnify:CR=1 FL=1
MGAQMAGLFLPSPGGRTSGIEFWAGWFGGPAPGSGPALERLTQGELSPQQVLEHQSQLLLAPQKDMHIYLSLLSSPRGCHTKEAAIQPSCPAGKLIRTVAKHPTSC